MKIGKTTALVVALVGVALFAAACSKAGASPTATAKAFYDAAKARDAQGMKNTMSKASLEMMEKLAKMDNKSLDDALKDPTMTPDVAFETRNEKITGDVATVEVKNGRGGWDNLPFVKEDGQWKIAFDKAFQQQGMDVPADKTGAEETEAGEHDGH